ncbi:MAG: NAD(P)H-dependent oxidoreductase [Gemmatimonadetes bacterium]|nr:NAD(P)H-dependent oxidoreductase [Gemmatimonadota bacterium]
MDAVLISGSPSASSKSRTLLERAQAQLEAVGCSTILIDLATLSADALLGRRTDDQLRSAVETVGRAQVVVASSPTYRATYSGLLKTFFDLLPQDCLVGKIGIPILTGGGPWHRLALDHSFSPLFTSLGATVVNGVYGHDGQFKNGPDAALLERVDRAIDDALAVARASSEAMKP